MAKRNGLGPDNEGPLTGRGLGNCVEGAQKVIDGVSKARALGRGRAISGGRGMGRGLNRGQRRRSRFFS